MRRLHPPCPAWFQLTIAAGVAVLLRVVTMHPSAASTSAPAAPVSLAFFGWIIAAAGFIWDLFHTAADVIVAWLVAAVNGILFVLNLVVKGLALAGRVILRGFKEAWGFFRTVYDDVLKPAWRKFWTLVDYARTQLERIFKPVLKYLTAIRDQVLKFYAKWIRPVLDTIDVARKILAVFTALGFEWAKTLDRKLLALEQKILAPFRLVLAKVNEIINAVNRVMTADGLFQRLALIRSLERDVTYVTRLWWNKQLKGMTAEELAQRAARKYARDDTAALGVELGKFYTSGDGDFAGIIGELVPLWRVSAGYPEQPTEAA